MPMINSYTVTGCDAQDLYDSIGELPVSAYVVDYDVDYELTADGKSCVKVILRFEAED